jgi:hypothetical protein
MPYLCSFFDDLSQIPIPANAEINFFLTAFRRLCHGIRKDQGDLAGIANGNSHRHVSSLQSMNNLARCLRGHNLSNQPERRMRKELDLLSLGRLLR